LSQEPPPWSAIDAERAIAWVQQKLGMDLAASQRAAASLALRHKVLVVTGGPGVGKTTLVNSLLKILRAKSRASMRLSIRLKERGENSAFSAPSPQSYCRKARAHRANVYLCEARMRLGRAFLGLLSPQLGAPARRTVL
jgi:ATP-dependent exoDNAse (exonuclease V) alpha subunit